MNIDDYIFFFFFQAEDGIRDHCVTGVQTCALPISSRSSSIGRSVKKHFDLDVVAPRRIMRHPAARLEMEILQIVAGPFAACFLAQHLKVLAVFTTAVDAGQILEEHARSVE